MLLKTLPWYFRIDGADSEFDHQKSIKYGFTFLEDHIGKLSAEFARELASYMKNSQIVRAWMGMRPDPLDPSKNIYTSDWSDGYYRWNDLHTYLVENYHMALPALFMDHVASFAGDWSHLGQLDQKSLELQFEKSDKAVGEGNTELILRY